MFESGSLLSWSMTTYMWHICDISHFCPHSSSYIRMRMRTSIFKNPPPHPHTEWVGLLHTLPRTPPNLFLIDTASDSQPDRRKLIIVLISIRVFFLQPSEKEWWHFKPPRIGHGMRFTNLFFWWWLFLVTWSWSKRKWIQGKGYYKYIEDID